MRILDRPRKQRKPHEPPIWSYVSLPVAQQTRRIQELAQIPSAILELIKSGLFPPPSNPVPWHVRAIRIVGGVLLLAFFLIVITVAWMNALQNI